MNIKLLINDNADDSDNDVNDNSMMKTIQALFFTIKDLKIELVLILISFNSDDNSHLQLLS